MHILDLGGGAFEAYHYQMAGIRRFFYIADPGIPLLLPGAAPGLAKRINPECRPLFMDWRGEDGMLGGNHLDLVRIVS